MKRRSAALLLFAGVSGAVWWNLPSTQNSRQASDCQSNLKQIGLAMMQYARDYDEKYPQASSWQDTLLPYRKQRFSCPTPGNSYAFNRFLSGATTTQVSELPGTREILGQTVLQLDGRGSTPMCYDVSQGNGDNLSDDGSLWPTAPVHWQGLEGVNVVFADAHVKMLTRKPKFVKLPPKPTPTPKPTSAPKKAAKP